MTHHDYPVEQFRAALISRTIVRVEQHPDTDEGLLVTLENGVVFDCHFNSNEGGMELRPSPASDEPLLDFTKKG